MTKYDGPLAEAASVIANHGFAQETTGTVEYGPGWFAWAVVSPVLMLNVGEADLAGQVRAVIGDTEYDVIISEDSNGFVSTEEAFPRGGAAIEQAWREIADYQERLDADGEAIL